MTTHTEHLDQLIADLTHDIEVTTERLRMARELRATYDDEPTDKPSADPEPADDAAERRRARDRKRKAKERAKKSGGYDPSEEVSCPDCGQRMRRAGLGPHRRAKHPESAAKPVAPVPAPEPPADDEQEPTGSDIAAAGRMFCCSQCEARTHTRSGLAKHTDSAHRRGLKGDEHFAKAVAS